MSGMPEWLRSKCSPDGVMMPSSKCNGVRDGPTPCVAGFGGGGVTLTTLTSKRSGATRRLQAPVVYSKRPFGGPEAVLAYLSRYTHRVAIANSRPVGSPHK